MAGDSSENDESRLPDEADPDPGVSGNQADGEWSELFGESNDGEGVPRTIHDGFFKEVFAEPEHAASALRAITPEAIARYVDWSSLEPDRASLNRDEFRQTHCDLLFKARWVTGEELLLQILFEHQSTVDRWMILRGLAMVHAVWERHRKRDRSAKYLPAVLMYVVYHGSTPWTAPTSLDEMLLVPDEVREDLGPYVPSFRFVLDDLHVVSDESLAERDTAPYPKLSLVMLRSGRKEDVLETLAFHAPAITSLLRMEDGYRLLETVIRYLWGVNPGMDAVNLASTLKTIIGPEAKNIMMTFAQRLRKEGFDEAVEKGRRQWMDEGMKEGMKEGMAMGQRKILLGLLQQSFGEVSDEAQRRIERAPVEMLERWVMRVRDARSVDEVLGDG